MCGNPTLSNILKKYWEKIINPSRPDPGRREKINLNYYFHTSLWCFKRFYEGLKGLHKTFWGTTKKCENKNLSWFLFYYNFLKCTGCEGLTIDWEKKISTLSIEKSFLIDLLATNNAVYHGLLTSKSLFLRINFQ